MHVGISFDHHQIVEVRTAIATTILYRGPTASESEPLPLHSNSTVLKDAIPTDVYSAGEKAMKIHVNERRTLRLMGN